MRRPEDSVLLIIVVGLIIAVAFAEEPKVNEPSITTTWISESTIASVHPTSSITPTSSSSTTSTETRTSTHIVPTITTSSTPSPTPTHNGVFYNVRDNEDPNRSCILFSAEMIQVTLNYVTINGTIQPKVFNLYNSSMELNRKGSNCTKGRAYLTIDWRTTPTSSATQSLMFYFTRQEYTWKLGLIELVLNTTDNDFPNIKSLTEFHFQYEKVVFENEYERSYKCDKSQRFGLENTDASVTVINVTTVALMPVWRIQAFEFRKENEFGNARICPQSIAKNIKLPAIVGGVLFLLLSAVVVVYIISRFRRRKLASYAALK